MIIPMMDIDGELICEAEFYEGEELPETCGFLHNGQRLDFAKGTSENGDIAYILVNVITVH